MTHLELPARAANILRAIEDGSTCDSAVVESLKLLLLPIAATPQREFSSRNVPRQNDKKVAPSRPRATATRAKRRAVVEVFDCSEIESHPDLKPQERLVVATEVVNKTLKALTTAIKNARNPQTPSPKSRVCVTSASRVSMPHFSTPTRGQTPLQQICTNRVLQSPSKSKDVRPTSPGLSKDSNCVRAQAECSRVALACLRSLQSAETMRTKFAPLQLENGMSALIAKLLMLRFDDLAVSELHILKKRIESLSSQDGAPSKASCDVRRKPASDNTILQRDALPDLLKYKTSSLTYPLRGLVITSQIQVLKVLALKGHGPSIEASLKHLRTDVESAPSQLVEKQIDRTNPTTKINAAYQLETLAQAILRLCPTPSRANDESSKMRSSLSPQSSFELQSIALRIRIRWWNLSGHQPNVDSEIFSPFSRYLDALERRCSLQGSEKYTMAKDAFNSITEALGSRETPSLSALLAVLKTLADQANAAGLIYEAIQWTEKGVKSICDIGGSHLQRSAFLCRLATYRLLATGQHLDDDPTLTYLRDVASSIEGDLSGESSHLDDLLFAIADLRKAAFSLVQSNAKAFDPSQILLGTSILGQCLHVILYSFRFLVRYVGRKPDSDAIESKLSRYGQRRHLAKQMLPSMISSIIAVSRLFLTTSVDKWQRFDTAFQNILELAMRIGTSPELSQENGTAEDVCPSPHVSISSIYWLRFKALKKMSAEPKVFLDSVKTSVDVLENRPSDEKAQGSFLMKVETYASLCETYRDYETSAKFCRKAIQLLIETGGMKILAEAATSISWPSVMAQNSNFEQTSRIFSTFAKVISKFDPQDLSSKIFDADWLPCEERGLVLELQLNALISPLFDRGVPHINWETLQPLSRSILSLYGEGNLLARRLHVCVRLLQVSVAFPLAAEKASEFKILEEAKVSLNDLADIDKYSSQPYVRHLVFQIDLYQKLIEVANASNFEAVLTDWWRLAQSCPDRQALEQHVYDISSWLQQLELMSEHLNASGHESLQTAVLNLIVEVREKAFSMKSSDLALSLMSLALHYAKIGYSGLGGLTLQRAQRLLYASEVSPKLLLHWCVINAEYGALCGNVDVCGAFIKQGIETLQIVRRSLESSPNDRPFFAQAAADLTFIQSRYSCEQGHPEKALFFARAAVQEYQRIWLSLSRRVETRRAKTDEAANADEKLVAAAAALSLAENKANSESCSKYATLRILNSWNLALRLFTSIFHLSRCFAHSGIILEAQYYLDQSQKIADAIQSPAMIRACLALRGEYSICAGETEQGLTILHQVEASLSTLSYDYGTVTINASVALQYMKANRIEAGSTACKESLCRLQSLSLKSGPQRFLNKPSPAEHLGLQVAGLRLQPVIKDALSTKKPRKVQKKPLKSSSAEPRREACSQDEEIPRSDIIPLNGIKGDVLRHSSIAELSRGSLEGAMTLLDEASALSVRQRDLIMQELLRSQVYLSQTCRRLLVDPVLSVLPESTICCPAATISPETGTLPKFLPKVSKTNYPKARGKTSNKRAADKEALSPQDSLQYLPLAQRCLTAIFSQAQKTSSTATIHAISETLGRILTMLSVIPRGADSPFSSPQFMSYILELGRQIAIDRESSSIRAECLLSGSRDLGMLPEFEESGNVIQPHQKVFDFSTFQEDYLDIIPKSWTVLSLTLSKSNDEMWISRLRAGQSPFILRLPFNRENASETDEEGLTFNEGRAEMLDIIKLANISAHSTGDLSQKGAKKVWWDNRTILDTRLKDLMTNIESIWLGGFRGIFSHEMPEPQLLARFEKTLQNILGKYLPSRQTLAKTKTNDQIRLDPRILELFVGLGPPTEENDVDEQLMDLLYFVVDILQFRNERNAYDEIDFDAIVVETADALRQYHQAAGTSDRTSEKQHTILIMDRNLHSFPWESMPCMTGQSVSRLPSLGCMRRRILEMRKEQNGKPGLEFSDGICISPVRGSYILNPGGDLANTQATFEKPLKELSSWTSFVDREPTEAEVKSSLQDSKIFLYFGHGSGGQYIRSRTIKKLDKCAVTLLMGCSSGALTQAGEYEAYGTPISYMHGGCPALLATLWDVTDKDIDRFSDRVLRTWGLLKEQATPTTSSPTKKSVKSKGKSKAKLEEPVVLESDQGSVSLDEAVAKSRDSCILKYLNGAAPVVYGIPVYLE